MPILDLVTPWAAAARGTDPSELERFLARSADLLEPVRRQRAATEPHLPPPADWGALAELAGDGALHQALRDTRDRLADRGLTAPRRIVLLATTAPGGAMEVVPEPGAETIALFVDRVTPVAQGGSLPGLAAGLRPALAAAMAVLTRWSAPDNPIAAIAARAPWDRWAAAREVPLAEWVYAAGIGAHAAQLVAESPAAALGIGEGELRRLRGAERGLQARLDGELDHTGMGLPLRWLEDDAPVAMRRCADGFIVPAGAGRYLGWRMLAERVERVGLTEAARMSL